METRDYQPVHPQVVWKNIAPAHWCHHETKRSNNFFRKKHDLIFVVFSWAHTDFPHSLHCKLLGCLLTLRGTRIQRICVNYVFCRCVWTKDQLMQVSKPSTLQKLLNIAPEQWGVEESVLFGAQFGSRELVGHGRFSIR